jgi:hypothetical protein
MGTFAQLVGAAALLVAFLAAQTGRMNISSHPYQLLNLFGSAILAIVALYLRQWGFLALEGAWAITAAITLARPRSPRGSSPIGPAELSTQSDASGDNG